MKTTEERKSHCRLVQVLQLILQQPLPSIRRDYQTQVHKPEQLLTQAIRCEEAKDSDEPRTDPCSESQYGMGNARGSSRPDRPATRARGISPASARRGQLNSSATGGGVGKARSRTLWQ